MADTEVIINRPPTDRDKALIEALTTEAAKHAVEILQFELAVTEANQPAVRTLLKQRLSRRIQITAPSFLSNESISKNLEKLVSALADTGGLRVKLPGTPY